MSTLGLTWVGLLLAHSDSTLAVPPSMVWPALFLAVLAVLGELKPIWLLFEDGAAQRSIALSTPAVVALIEIAGPLSAALVQMAAMVIVDLKGRRAPYKLVFNAAQYAISVLVAGRVYDLLGSDLDADASRADGAAKIGALLLAGLVMVASNYLLVGIAVTLLSGQSLLEAVREDAGNFFVTHTVLLVMGAIAAQLAHHGLAPAVLILVPVVAAHYYASAGARHAYEAAHDGLTGLGNRGRLHQTLEGALEAASGDREAGPALVLLDLDHFKDFNDTLGHPIGDEILREVAARFVGAAQDAQAVHRLGGDEFAVVVHGGAVAARACAEDLLDALRSPVKVGGLELMVRASAGVAIAPRHGDTVATLMKNADIALYEAKVERDRISTFSPEFDVNTVERLRLLADLRAALERRMIHVEYQPQFDLDHGGVVAVEALARWSHPERGPIPADEFVQLAENSGLIHDLTACVLDAALGRLAGWRALGHDIRMSVNLSARHLADLALPQQVASALERHGVPADRLVLEVTETGVLADAVRADVVLRAVRRLGVAIAIDDYGTGNASLTYLRRLEIDELKIDRSFVSSIGEDHHDLIIVRSTIALALELGLRVVAEGVENQATVELLRGFGSVVGQGFHLGRPMPPAEIEVLLGASERVADAAGGAGAR
ncbi:putative bifunctional diguanylate cyclase/phosphodiesterase [Demequina mangrovi]|uniref:putative bifunctional diguanylate cyclase/phosphodiesterase n=1 Tax=Demequina mangrovi TaxID=1043493 RepID=UPI000693476E|nr:EAL domain-containing protein [Demequina mangrovi]